MANKSYDVALLKTLQVYALMTPTLYLPAGFGAIALVDLLLPLGFLLALMRAAKLPPLFLLYLAYIGTALLSLAVAESSTIDFSNWLLAVRLLSISLPFWLVYCFSDFGREECVQLISSILAGMGFATLLGILLHFFGIEVGDSQQRLWGAYDFFSTAAVRAGGIVGNSTEYGTTVAIFGIATLSASAFHRDLSPAAKAAALAMVAAGLVFSSSRAGFLMLLVFLFSLSVLRFRLMFRETALAVAAPTIGVMALLLLGSSEQLLFLEISLRRLDVLNVTGQGEFLESVRTQTWDMLYSIMFQVPVFGYGFKSSYGIFQVFIDNAYLQAWFEVGPVGAVLFMSFWIVLTFIMIARFLRGGSAEAAVGVAFVLTVLVAMVVTGPQSSWSTMPTVFLMLGMSLRAAERKPSASRPGFVGPAAALE